MKPLLDMDEMMARELDGSAAILGAQRLDDGAVFIDGADRLARRFIDRNHHRGTAEKIAQEARQFRIAESIDEMNMKGAREPHRLGAVAPVGGPALGGKVGVEPRQ